MHGDESGMADEACGDQFVFDLDQYFYIIVIYQLERCDRIQEEYRKLLLFIITSGQILSLMSSVDVSCII